MARGSDVFASVSLSAFPAILVRGFVVAAGPAVVAATVVVVAATAVSLSAVADAADAVLDPPLATVDVAMGIWTATPSTMLDDLLGQCPTFPPLP